MKLFINTFLLGWIPFFLFLVRRLRRSERPILDFRGNELGGADCRPVCDQREGQRSPLAVGSGRAAIAGGRIGCDWCSRFSDGSARHTAVTKFALP